VDLPDRLSTQNVTGRNLLLRSGIEATPGLLASIMHPHFARAALAAILVLATPLALADVYTWKDPAGRLNVSNVRPPEGVTIESVVHEDPPKVPPGAAARQHDADMQALNERVARLQDEVERAKEQAALPPVVYRPTPAPPPVQVNVNVMPAPAVAAPANADYAPSYPPYPYAYSYGYPYPGYPGLPRDYCEPTVFGCPVYGLPVGVVVLSAPHSHVKHFDRMRGPVRPGSMGAMPIDAPQAGMRPAMPSRGRFGAR
jgi:hypothetical protein